jgi:hypothetical protein
LLSWFEEGFGSFASSIYLRAIIIGPVGGQRVPPGQ